MKSYTLVLAGLFWIFSCSSPPEKESPLPASTPSTPYLVVLGTAQDAGFPQAGCQKDCCKTVWENPALREMVSCLAFVDPQAEKAWIFDATPDFKDQIQHLSQEKGLNLAGIFLTHAHMGHYTGLMQLGREVMGSDKMPVYTMPRMENFLRENGPWGQLVKLENIKLQTLQNLQAVPLGPQFHVTPIQVPHRDEYSETVGYSIQGPQKKVLFIPDIDKWEQWEWNIDSVVQAHDLSFLDATFYQNGEIPGRDMSQIPHPFVEESMLRFEQLAPATRQSIYFIHFNHTNPLLDQNSVAYKRVKEKGFNIAKTFQVFEL